MKFSTDKKELLTAIATSGKAVKNTTSMPILSNILVKAENGKVVFKGYDTQLGIECDLNNPVIVEEGSALVSARSFSDFVKKMPNGDILVSKENGSLVLSSGKTKVKIACGDAQSYPELPIVENGEVLTIKSVDLAKAVNGVSYAVATDESRLSLTGISLKCAGGILTAVAIDGFRLALRKVEISNVGDFDLLIPGKELNEVLKVIDSETDINISFDTKHAIFDIGGVRVYTRILTGPFVSYEQIIVKNCKSSVVLPTGDTLNAMERAFLAAATESHSIPVEVKNSPTKDTFEFNCSVSSINTHDEVSTETDLQGEDVDLSINAKYVIDALKNIDDESFKVEFNGATGPVIFKPTSGEDYLMLVLPVRR